jgi:hypothetical protein
MVSQPLGVAGAWLGMAGARRFGNSPEFKVQPGLRSSAESSEWLESLFSPTGRRLMETHTTSLSFSHGNRIAIS